MKDKALNQQSKRILNQLKTKYPGKDCYDLDGRGLHFVCELDSVSEHPEFDRAVEVIIYSKPHKHLKMTQYYTIIDGKLELHVGEKVITLNTGDKYVVEPGKVHWAKSGTECWVEIYSEPGWTKEDHFPVD